MGWWDRLTSWMDGFWDNAASIEANTVAWAIQSAYSIVDAASDSFDILKHSWYDVTGYVSYYMDNLPSFYSILNYTYTEIANEINSAKNEAVSIANNAAHSIVDAALSAYTSMHSIVNYTWSDVIKTTNQAKYDAMNFATNGIETLRVTFDAALSSAIAVEGAARAALADALYAAINAVESGAKAALDVVNRTLTEAINSVQAGAAAALLAVQNALTIAINTVEREAKEAREVLEGNLIYMLEELEKVTLTIITAIDERLKGTERWIGDSITWFDTQFNTMQSRVVTWIVDSFISIIERVMEKEK